MGQSKSSSRRGLEVTRIQYLQYKRTREAIVTQKEKELLKCIQDQQPRNKQSEIHQLSQIIEDFLTINAAETIIRKTDVLKDCALTVNQSQGRLQPIRDLSPFIENICLKCINNFSQEMMDFFGEDLEMSIQKSQNIDERVRKAISPPIVASNEDMNGYAKKFCFKYNITIEQFNGTIHNFSNACNSSISFGHNCSNQNIYSPSSSNQSFNRSHYQNCFSSFCQKENQAIPSRMIPINNKMPEKDMRKNKYLFCF